MGLQIVTWKLQTAQIPGFAGSSRERFETLASTLGSSMVSLVPVNTWKQVRKLIALFILVKNHGIPEDKILGAVNAGKDFFALSEETKMKVRARTFGME